MPAVEAAAAAGDEPVQTVQGDEGDGGSGDAEEGGRSRIRCPFNWVFVEECAVVEAGFALYARHPEVRGAEAQGEVVVEEYKTAVEGLTEEWKKATAIAKHLRQKPVPSQEDSILWRAVAGGRHHVKHRGHYILERFRTIVSEVVRFIQPLLHEHPVVLPPGESGGPETLVDGSTDWEPVLEELKKAFYQKVKARRDPDEAPPNWEDARWYAFEAHGPHVTGRALADQFTLSRLSRLMQGLALFGTPSATPRRKKTAPAPTPAATPTPAVAAAPTDAPAIPAAAPSSARQPTVPPSTTVQQEKALARVLLEQRAAQKQQAAVLEVFCERRFYEGQLATLKAQVEVLGMLAKQASELDDKAEQRRCLTDLRAVHQSMADQRKEAAEAEAKRRERAEEAALEQEAGKGLMEMRKRIRLAGGTSAVALQPPAQSASLCIHMPNAL